MVPLAKAADCGLVRVPLQRTVARQRGSAPACRAPQGNLRRLCRRTGQDAADRVKDQCLDLSQRLCADVLKTDRMHELAEVPGDGHWASLRHSVQCRLNVPADAELQQGSVRSRP
jgi:hypothetical protein